MSVSMNHEEVQKYIQNQAQTTIQPGTINPTPMPSTGTVNPSPMPNPQPRVVTQTPIQNVPPTNPVNPTSNIEVANF